MSCISQTWTIFILHGNKTNLGILILIKTLKFDNHVQVFEIAAMKLKLNVTDKILSSKFVLMENKVPEVPETSCIQTTGSSSQSQQSLSHLKNFRKETGINLLKLWVEYVKRNGKC